MNLNIQGKAALVTGGSKGVGKYTALALAREGADVAILARGEQSLRETADWLEQQVGVRPLTIQGDASDPQAAGRAVSAVVERYGRLDILINNAGGTSQAPFEQVEEPLWASDLDLKVLAAVRFSRAAVEPMKRAGGGAIVNIVSILGKAPRAASLPTSVSRAAGLALTKAMSKDLAAHRIRVNAVCLAMVRGNQAEVRWQRDAPELTWEQYEQNITAGTPLRRFGTAGEAANVIVFLASGAASFVTGTAVNVDGGLVDAL